MHQAGCTKHLPLQTHTNPLESGTGMCLPKFGTEMETNLWIEKRLLETNLCISIAQKAMSPNRLPVMETGRGAWAPWYQ